MTNGITSRIFRWANAEDVMTQVTHLPMGGSVLMVLAATAPAGGTAVPFIDTTPGAATGRTANHPCRSVTA